MAIGTYAELLTAADAWLTRSDMTDRWPECIALAEGVANRLLDCRQMYARTAAFTIDSETESLPTGFAGVRSFRLNTAERSKLSYVRPDAFDSVRDDGRDGVGRPEKYTILGELFVFDVAPDSTYTATLSYRLKVPALTTTNTTNWLLTAFPDVYLHGVLSFGFQYIEDVEQERKYFSNFTTGIEQINADDSRHAFGSAPSRRVRGFV